MKLPSLRNIERVVRMVPVVKDFLPDNQSGLNSLINESAYKIKKLEDDLHDKKAEICTLRFKIKDLQHKTKLLQDQIEGLDLIWPQEDINHDKIR